MKNLLTILAVFLIAASCEKGEIAIPKLDRGSTITQSTPASNYSNQFYFDLETNSFVKQNNKVIWDIAFGCGPHTNLILTNTSKSVSVARQSNSNFEDITSANGLDFKFESSTGHPDSTAFDNWSTNEVFVLDLGYDDKGAAQGFGKIKIVSNSEAEVTFQYGLLSDTEPKTETIEKDNAYNAVFFSIKNSEVVSVEPPKANWDLCFTQYIFYFWEFDQPYLVIGVLLNRSNVAAYLHESEDYLALNYDKVDEGSFSPYLDVIGYNWKVFNNTGYEVNSDLNYVINSTEGFYYKLQFIGFYDESGEKGFPKFEFQKI